MNRYRGLKTHAKPGYNSKFYCLCRSCRRYSSVSSESAYVKTKTARYTRRTTRVPVEMPMPIELPPRTRLYVYHAS
jgi:hypothetical protein